MTVSDRELVLTDEFERALALLGGGRHVFLTGKAGTGKSTLIRRFISDTDRNVVVVAPTGIAALNVDGYTIHRLFSFSTTTTLDDVRTGRYYPGRFAKILGSLDTLIVDEASMVRADLFDQVAAALNGSVRNRELRSVVCRSCSSAISTSYRPWSTRPRPATSRRGTRPRTSSPPTVSASRTSRPWL